MRLGLLADIHEQLPRLRAALKRFRRERVDRVVVLGDVFEMGLSLRATVDLLIEAGAVGVWGNHDFGLSHNPEPDVMERYAGPVLSFMTSLRPRLEIADCLFSHTDPWLNPEELSEIWYVGDPPDTAERIARSFQAFPHRVMFFGHFHRWRIVTPHSILDWRGEQPIRLLPGCRYLVVVHAVSDGYCAIYDTDTCELTPFRQEERGRHREPS